MLPVSFAFFGTDAFAVATLDALHRGGSFPAAVVTAPDRPRGRGMRLTPPPAKIWAAERGIPVRQPDSVDAALIRRMREDGTDLFLVASYGRRIPDAALMAAPRGFLNIHPSLLPKYRGPSPVQTHILADDPNTGVSLMRLDEKMDHGPIVAAARVPPPRWPLRAPELARTLAEAGARLFLEQLPAYAAGTLVETSQDDAQATETKKIAKEDGRVDERDIVERPSETYRKFCAYTPWPGIYFFDQRRTPRVSVLISDASFENGIFSIRRVRPEGKREMSWEDFKRGFRRSAF
jgi:methionyl-tRNA formyltransferase